MSRFYRPNPTTAKAAEIAATIKEIKTWNWEVGYSFAHNVLGDLNLGDGSILFCLEQKRIDEWVNQRIEQHYGKPVADPETLEEWERYGYYDEIELRDEIIIALRWLLHTSEEERDKVYD